MTAVPEPDRTLIDDLLAEQQRLTAVERFARQQDRGPAPAQERYYRALLPVTKPAAGEQYAFAVDLDACTGCKACVSACHSLNGLDEDEIWRNVGVIHGGTSAAPYQQTVTTACHHCVEPACLEGCPVRAYEKDAETGIVRHLDDQCIGCQYCVLKCPYDVPKYSAKRGIVRKCDMCSSRLAVGEAPACVQACPTSAISIRVVSTSAVKRDGVLVPGAFDSGYTLPTTSYLTRREMPPNARPGDATVLRLEHAHWPLIGMLLLTQLAGGMFAGAALLAWLAPSAFAAAQMPLALTAFALLNLGLAVSVFHLGRPLGAWRAFLGLRTSWMSREIVAFAVFAGAAAAFAGAAAWPWFATAFPNVAKIAAPLNPAVLVGPLAWVTACLATVGIFCSAMIYIDTRRAFWTAPLVLTRFFGTALLLGAAGCAALLGWIGAPMAEPARVFATAAVVIRAVLAGWEAMNFRTGLARPATPNHRSMLVMSRLGRPLVIGVVVLSIGAIFSGLLSLDGAAVWAAIAFLLNCAAQTIERYFFFTAVIAPRMPGGVTV